MELHVENNILLGFKEDGHMWLNGEPEYMHLVVPDSITAIADFAFDGCKEIIGVTIPGSVKIHWRKSVLLLQKSTGDCHGRGRGNHR